MDAHRVDVLDAADDHAVVRVVPHHLEFVLLPPDDRLLDEDLADRTRLESGRRHRLELLGRVGDAGSPATEDVRRTDDGRQADVGDHGACIVHRVRGARAQAVEADPDHRLLELLAVFGGGDRFGVRSDHLRGPRHADQPSLEQFHGQVQTRLAAQCGQDRIGPLPVDDGRDDLPRQRLHVGGIREVRVRHDRGRIRVRQDDPVPLVAQHTTRLGARVVELAGLPDDDRSRSDDQDGVDVRALGHQDPPARASAIICANSSNR